VSTLGVQTIQQCLRIRFHAIETNGNSIFIADSHENPKPSAPYVTGRAAEPKSSGSATSPGDHSSLRSGSRLLVPRLVIEIRGSRRSGPTRRAPGGSHDGAPALLCSIELHPASDRWRVLTQPSSLSLLASFPASGRAVVVSSHQECIGIALAACSPSSSTATSTSTTKANPATTSNTLEQNAEFVDGASLVPIIAAQRADCEQFADQI
jgi:hypothetical protein